MARTNNLSDFLTDVASAIKEKKGDTTPIKASNFDAEIISLPTGGGKYAPRKISFQGYTGKELDYELENLDFSNCQDFSYMFNNCYSLTRIQLNNTINNVNNLDSTFYGCGNIETLDISYIDMSKATNVNSLFYNCSKLATLIGNLDTSNCERIAGMFGQCYSLTSVPEINGTKARYVANVLYGMRNLENCGGILNIGEAYLTTASQNYNNYTIDVSQSTKLTHDSLMNIINKLYNIGSKGVKPQKLVLGSANLAKLTSEEIAIATNKGWVVS